MPRYSKGYVAFYLISVFLMDIMGGFLLYGLFEPPFYMEQTQQVAGGILGIAFLLCGVFGPIYYFCTGEIPIGTYHE